MEHNIVSYSFFIDNRIIIIRIVFTFETKKPMGQTRGGEVTSAQIGSIGVIDNLNNANFKKEEVPFNIKNDGETAVMLEVNLWGMEPGEFVSTRFETGWNPEIVREIKQTSLSNLNLKWGY